MLVNQSDANFNEIDVDNTRDPKSDVVSNDDCDNIQDALLRLPTECATWRCLSSITNRDARCILRACGVTLDKKYSVEDLLQRVFFLVYEHQYFNAIMNRKFKQNYTAEWVENRNRSLRNAPSNDSKNAVILSSKLHDFENIPDKSI